MAEQVFLSFVSAFFMRCSETPRHMMRRIGMRTRMGQKPSRWKIKLSIQPILAAFGGSMARKEAERNTRYG